MANEDRPGPPLNTRGGNAMPPTGGSSEQGAAKTRKANDELGESIRNVTGYTSGLTKAMELLGGPSKLNSMAMKDVAAAIDQVRKSGSLYGNELSNLRESLIKNIEAGKRLRLIEQAERGGLRGAWAKTQLGAEKVAGAKNLGDIMGIAGTEAMMAAGIGGAFLEVLHLISSEIGANVAQMISAVRVSISAGGGFGGMNEALNAMRRNSVESTISMDDLSKGLDAASASGSFAKNSLSGVLSAIDDVAFAGNTLGMSLEESTKTMFAFGQQLSLPAKQMGNALHTMALEAGSFGLAPKAMISAMQGASEAMRGTSAGFWDTNTTVMQLFSSFTKMSSAMKDSAFWAEKAPMQKLELVQDAIKAFSSISTEQLLAYTKQPLGDFGTAVGKVMEMNLGQRMGAALGKLLPYAEQGPHEGWAARLMYLLPQLSQMPGQVGYRVAQMAVNQRAELMDILGKETAEEQIAGFEKVGIAMSGLDKSLYVFGDAQKALLNLMINFTRFVTGWMTTGVVGLGSKWWGDRDVDAAKAGVESFFKDTVKTGAAHERRLGFNK